MRAGWPRRAERDSYRRVSQPSRVSVERSARTRCRLTLECWLLLLVLPPRCYEAEVKTPWQSSRTSGKQGRLRRTVVHEERERKKGGEREREKTYTKAAIFRKGNQRRAFRAAYHRATPPPLLCDPPFHNYDDDHLIVSLSFPGFGSISTPGALSAACRSNGFDR